MKHLIKTQFPLTRKTASTVMNSKNRRKFFKNDVHHQEKAPNKSMRLVINRKSVSASQNEGLIEKYDFTGLKSFHSNQCTKN